MNQDATPVCRLEIVDAVESAFSGTPVSKAELVSAATLAEARHQVVDLLDTFPERKYRRLADLWDVRPEVPIEPDQAVPPVV